MSNPLDDAIARGADEAEQMQSENRPGGKFKATDWFNLPKDRSFMVVRLLDDEEDWRSALHHQFTLTRPQPPDWPQGKNWPKKMGAVCRDMKSIAKLGIYEPCYICRVQHLPADKGGGGRPNPNRSDGKWYPSTRIWARAVQREEVVVTPENQDDYPDEKIGTTLGWRDVEVEVDELDAEGKPTGNKVMKKRVMVINQAMKNFFGQLKAYHNVYGTVLDRDYHITRKGEDQNTDYDIVAMNPNIRSDGSILDLRTAMELDAEGNETGRTRREAILEDAPNVVELIGRQLDDELYHKFFDHRKPYPEFRGGNDKKDDNGGSSGSSSSRSNGHSNGNGNGAKEADSAGSTMNSDRLRALRDRVTGDHGKSNGAAEAPAPEESTEAPAEEKPSTAGAPRRRPEFD